MNKNTLKNMAYLVFATMIFVAYNFNFADIVMQNGLFAGVLVEILLVLPLVILLNKLITELPSNN